MLNFIQYILESLNPSQKIILRSWTNEIQGQSPAQKISSHVKFDKNGRIFFPLTQTESGHDLPQEIVDHLSNKGYSPLNNIHAQKEEDVTIPAGKLKGQTIKRKRKVSIGSILSDNPELQKKYAEFGAKGGSRSQNLMVAISRNPEDVAGMSTNRGWGSCKRMRNPESNDPIISQPGVAERYLKNDITTTGTHVAYLINPDDREIENPIARISLNPYVSASGNHTILRPPRDMDTKDGKIQQYGGGSDAFGQAVQKWSEDNFPQREDEPFYKIHDMTYDDEHLNDPNNRSHHFNPNLDDKTIGQVIAKASPHTVKSMLKHHPSITSKHVAIAYKRPDLHTKIAALSHPLVDRKHIDEALKGIDSRLHEAVMRNPNITSDDVAFGLRSPINTVKQVAANHRKVRLDDLHNALQDPKIDDPTREVIAKRIKQKETVDNILKARNR